MNENIFMTKISDLPETGDSGSKLQGQGLSNTYLPMDVHPNPYGMPPPSVGGILPPQQTQGFASPPSADELYREHSQKLPQRDIPMNISDRTHDEEVLANYIPNPSSKTTRDYIRDDQNDSENKIRQHEAIKSRIRMSETWLDEVQIPIMIGLLFFVFQLPIINTLIFKKITFLSIYNDDGNFNMFGLFIKSTCFAVLYYSIDKIIEYVY